MTPAYMIRQTPGGTSRDTYATLRMREGLRMAQKPAPADHWAHLSLAVRQALASEALGMRGLEVYSQAWTDIAGHDRLRIISAANRLAAGLV